MLYLKTYTLLETQVSVFVQEKRHPPMNLCIQLCLCVVVLSLSLSHMYVYCFKSRRVKLRWNLPIPSTPGELHLEILCLAKPFLKLLLLFQVVLRRNGNSGNKAKHGFVPTRAPASRARTVPHAGRGGCPAPAFGANAPGWPTSKGAFNRVWISRLADAIEV